MYDSVEMAKYIAAYWNEKRADVNMTKIQKLLYIAYGSWLAVYDKRLVNEHPQAWPFGPVFPRVRKKLLKMDIYAIKMSDVTDEDLKQNTEISSLCETIYKEFGDWLANELSAWSHKEGSPWEYAVTQPGFKWSAEIDDSKIKSYFANKVIANE